MKNKKKFIKTEKINFVNEKFIFTKQLTKSVFTNDKISSDKR